MKTISKLSLLAIALTLASCNEKVSPELQGGNSTVDPGSTTPIPPDEYYFAIVNSSPANANFKLHKTGVGNATQNCEVRNTSGLSNDAFRGNPAANDITCFFEAEELALMHTGMNFKIQASKNSCDYVGYVPYGYYNRIPGDSSGTYLQIECGDQTNGTHVALEAAGRGISIATSSADLTCGEYASQVISSATRVAFTPPSDEDLCRFNYRNGDEEKCDIGVITVNKLSVTYTADTTTRSSTLTSREIKCGGKVHNCVRGPTKAIKENGTRVIQITSTNVNQDFELEYKYPKIEGSTNSSIHYANYRRDLANLDIDLVSSDGLTAYYRSIWADPIFGKTFDPRVMDFYAANLRMDGSDLITDAALAAESIRNGRYTAIPLAADPYLGLGEQVNPFYSFYCFDQAYDIKARVRMVVRDWDRILPGNSDLEYISDLFRGANARQDIPGEVELPGDIDAPIWFNDQNDWDDKIPMERTIGSYDPFSTIWRPVPTVFYPDGFYNPSRFPNFQTDDGN